jgi:hypothetical protein
LPKVAPLGGKSCLDKGLTRLYVMAHTGHMTETCTACHETIIDGDESRETDSGFYHLGCLDDLRARDL